MVSSDADVEGAVCKEEGSQCHQAEGNPCILLPYTPAGSLRGRSGATWGDGPPAPRKKPQAVDLLSPPGVGSISLWIKVYILDLLWDSEE